MRWPGAMGQAEGKMLRAASERASSLLVWSGYGWRLAVFGVPKPQRAASSSTHTTPHHTTPTPRQRLPAAQSAAKNERVAGVPAAGEWTRRAPSARGKDDENLVRRAWNCPRRSGSVEEGPQSLPDSPEGKSQRACYSYSGCRAPQGTRRTCRALFFLILSCMVQSYSYVSARQPRRSTARDRFGSNLRRPCSQRRAIAADAHSEQAINMSIPGHPLTSPGRRRAP